MKEIFTDLYKKVLGFFQSHEKETSDREIACSRMKLVLMQDRTNLTPFLLERMRGEMIDVLSKYVEMNKDELELNFEQEGESMALMLSIPVVRAKDEDEINEMIKKEAEEKAAKEAEEAEKSETTDGEESEEENAEEAEGSEDSEEKDDSETSEEDENQEESDTEVKECGCSEECDETCECECHKAEKATEETKAEVQEEQKPSKKKNKKK